jgi:cyclopropane-fatty-acyl-phospholipid synthase
MYDARFFRMREFYLAGGIAMFESGAGCNYQVQYIRNRRALQKLEEIAVVQEDKTTAQSS